MIVVNITHGECNMLSHGDFRSGGGFSSSVGSPSSLTAAVAVMSWQMQLQAVCKCVYVSLSWRLQSNISSIHLLPLIRGRFAEVAVPSCCYKCYFSSEAHKAGMERERIAIYLRFEKHDIGYISTAFQFLALMFILSLSTCMGNSYHVMI